MKASWVMKHAALDWIAGAGREPRRAWGTFARLARRWCWKGLVLALIGVAAQGLSAMAPSRWVSGAVSAAHAQVADCEAALSGVPKRWRGLGELSEERPMSFACRREGEAEFIEWRARWDDSQAAERLAREPELARLLNLAWGRPGSVSPTGVAELMGLASLSEESRNFPQGQLWSWRDPPEARPNLAWWILKGLAMAPALLLSISGLAACLLGLAVACAWVASGAPWRTGAVLAAAPLALALGLAANAAFVVWGERWSPFGEPYERWVMSARLEGCERKLPQAKSYKEGARPGAGNFRPWDLSCARESDGERVVARAPSQWGEAMAARAAERALKISGLAWERQKPQSSAQAFKELAGWEPQGAASRGEMGPGIHEEWAERGARVFRTFVLAANGWMALGAMALSAGALMGLACLARLSAREAARGAREWAAAKREDPSFIARAERREMEAGLVGSAESRPGTKRHRL